MKTSVSKIFINVVLVELVSTCTEATHVYVAQDIGSKVAAMDLIPNAQVRTLHNAKVFFSKRILDKNECSLYKACQYECINAVGSYKCTCPPGYELQPSGKCKGKKYFESEFSDFHDLKKLSFFRIRY